MIEDLVLAVLALGGVLAYATVGVAMANVAERRLRPERREVRYGWLWALFLESLWLYCSFLAYSMLTTTALGESGNHLPGHGLETPLVLGLGIPAVMFMAVWAFCAIDYDDRTAWLMGIVWPLTILTFGVNVGMKALFAGPVTWGNYLSDIPMRVEQRAAVQRRKEQQSLADRKRELDERARRIAEKEIAAGLEPLTTWKDG